MDYRFIDRLLNTRNLVDKRIEIIVINQTKQLDAAKETVAKSIENLVLISSNDRGISKSRNQALINCSSDIAVICDDDLCFTSNLYESLIDAHNTYQEEIITTKIQTPNGGEYKKYKTLGFLHNKSSALKISSVEITLKTKAIKNAGIKFNEKFGLGTNCPSGEENIFMFDALDAGIKARFLPIFTVIHPPESSNSILTAQKMAHKKILFEKLFPYTHLPIKGFFYFKKYHHFKGLKEKLKALLNLYI